MGLLVPHAGLVYSGVPAAAGWGTLPATAADGTSRAAPPTVVLLGTNHGAGWLDGVGAWDLGPWATPADTVAIDDGLTADVLGLGTPFTADPAAHIGEHSIEVQLPLLAAASPGARLVALAVACGTGPRAIAAGERLGRLLAARRAAGGPVVLAISSDMAHYPPAAACEAITERLWPAIAAVDAERLAQEEAAVRAAGMRGVACGMCGIEPAVLGLAALRAMGATQGTLLAASTSADAGGPSHRTVGYLAVRFDA
jgi:AmmeMemoRadiSam system protein B